MIFAPSPSLLKDEGANTRNEKWREKNRKIVASPKVSLYAGRMKTGEGWPSGLRRAPGKRVGANVPQGFKSPCLDSGYENCYVFNKMLEGLFIERMEGNEEIFAKVMNDDKFRDVAKDHLLKQVYDKLRQENNESTNNS